MDRNVGPEDRVVRIVAAVGLGLLAYFVELGDVATIVVIAIATYLLATGAVAKCLVYKAIGVDTSVQEQPYSSTDDRSGV